jgi:hypothetical protein
MGQSEISCLSARSFVSSRFVFGLFPLLSSCPDFCLYGSDITPSSSSDGLLLAFGHSGRGIGTFAFVSFHWFFFCNTLIYIVRFFGGTIIDLHLGVGQRGERRSARFRLPSFISLFMCQLRSIAFLLSASGDDCLLFRSWNWLFMCASEIGPHPGYFLDIECLLKCLGRQPRGSV